MTTWNTIAALEVPGIPAPQGSKVQMPNGAMLEALSKTGRAKHKAWRETVTLHARQVAGRTPSDKPISIIVTFLMPMPKSRPAAARKLGSAPHAVKPDLDKLLRCTIDALADAKLFTDDSRIYHIEAQAEEVTTWTGAVILVREMESAA